jgi:hypothetical protein
MKHITMTSKIRPALAGEPVSWWQEMIDKVACLVDPELAKCEPL